MARGTWQAEIEAPEVGTVVGYRWWLDDETPVLDPYAPLVLGGEVWGRDVERAGQTKERWSGWQRDTFDWQGVEPPRVDPTQRVIYELDVRGYTQHATARVRVPGSYQGLCEKIPYWLELGVTTIELLPVFEFDELELERRHPESGEWLRNLWGYIPLSFFAPKAAYGSSADPGSATDELKTLIRECHRVGLEVVLDVVFNHTAEKELGERGDRDPVYSWVALDRGGYYLWDRTGGRRDVTGCGHTFAAAGPRGGEMILAALRHWRTEYRIDGFRFDLAAALTRDLEGVAQDPPELIRAIADDPGLQDCLLIAETWDAAGLYLLGEFPRWGPWAEWNGRFRDEVRCFVRGDAGQTRNVALRLLGSPDLYGSRSDGALHSINYVTCHDGFTLEDSVSYETKHNLANGEDNRDGDSWVPSWNGGIEGPTAEPTVVERRRRQVEMLLTLLFLARGTPMLLAGDEFGRTQGGNNNSYCQDNVVGWVDWGRLADHLDRHDLVRRLIRLRQRLPSLRSSELPADASVFGCPDVVWHGQRPLAPDWSGASRFLAAQWVGGEPETPDLYAAFNPTDQTVKVHLPESAAGSSWHELASGRRLATPLELPAWGTLLALEAVD